MARNDISFRPSRSETKAESTNAVARGLIDDESAARDEKTRRLRAARLERDLTQQQQESKATMPRKARTKKRTKP